MRDMPRAVIRWRLFPCSRPLGTEAGPNRLHPNFAWILLAACIVMNGCKGAGLSFGSSPNGTAARVVLAMTDTPATNVSLLSAEVTLTGATLNPGSVSLLPVPAQVELTRLQTDIAFLTATNVNAGTYTSLNLTFANPTITFENDTVGSIVAGVGNPTCSAGAVCTIQPITSNLSTSIPLPTLMLSSGASTGLLLDLNLNNLLSASFGADFHAGTTVSQFLPGGTGAPPVGAEDVVGQITAIDATHNTFSLQNVQSLVSLSVDGSANFFQFPSTACLTPAFACLHAGQILSVDIAMRSDGTVGARNIVFEDADSSDTEVEGLITAINTGAQTLNIVTLAESASVVGLKIGDSATVRYSLVPLSHFDIDLTHADNLPVDTTGYLFALPVDLALGQQVQVKRNPASSGNSITADRVRLRSSRFTASIQSLAAPIINLGGFSPGFPSIFSAHGTTQIQGLTSAPTIYSGTDISGLPITSFIQFAVGNSVSVRGPLFNLSGSRTLFVTKIALKQ